MSVKKGNLLRKALAATPTFLEAFKVSQGYEHPQRILFDKDVNLEIIDRLKLKSTFPNASDTLSIVENQATYNSLTYWMQQELKPKKHVLFANASDTYKFWSNMTATDPACQNMFVAPNGGVKLTLQFTDEMVESGQIQPKVENDPKKVNESVLIHTNYIQPEMQLYFRQLIYFNSINEGLFKYNNVKVLVWMTPADVLKYLGPIGSRYRKTNSFYCNTYADVDLIAYSNKLEKTSVSQYLDPYKNAIKLPSLPDQDDLCLIEMQSNHHKYNVEYPQEYDLIIHKLCVLNSRPLSESTKLLGPGATEYFGKVLPKELLSKSVINLTVPEMIEVSERYYEWAFKPDLNLELYLGES